MVKLLEDFHNDKKRKLGKYINCKECHYSYMRNRYKDPEVKRKRQEAHKRASECEDFKKRAKERSRKYYSGLEGRAITLWKGAKRSAIKKSIPFNIDIETVIEGISSGICPMTGVEFDMSGFHTTVLGRTRSPFAPSIDRITPSLGYVEGNVRVVTWHYNAFKGELTDDECIELCRKILEHDRSKKQ